MIISMSPARVMNNPTVNEERLTWNFAVHSNRAGWPSKTSHIQLASDMVSFPPPPTFPLF